MAPDENLFLERILYYEKLDAVLDSRGDFIGLAAMVYEALYHAREIATIKLSSGFSCKAKLARSCNVS